MSGALGEQTGNGVGSKRRGKSLSVWIVETSCVREMETEKASNEAYCQRSQRKEDSDSKMIHSVCGEHEAKRQSVRGAEEGAWG